MKREVSISVFAVLIVAATILTVYYLNVGLTGYAVFQQDTQTAFDEGTYTNVLYSSNSSSVALAPNQTSGSYTSKVFDSGNAASVWNNITSQNDGVTFEVRTCSTSDCANTSFGASNFGTGQYFQYKATFDSVNDSLTSVSVDYSVPAAEPAVTVDLTQPIGEQESLTGIPITFTTTGNNVTCRYEVTNGVTGAAVKNDTLPNCASTTFDLSAEADYILTVFATGNGGSASDQIGFSVSVPEEDEETETEVPEEEIPEIVPTQVSVAAVALGDAPTQDVVSGDSKAMSISASNTGTNTPLTACTLAGDDSGWISITDTAKDIGVGQSASFAFNVNVPAETAAGSYTLGLSVACAQTSASKQITVNVLQKKLDFNITSVQRTRDDRVRVEYTLTELTGEDQDVQIMFSIKDAAGVEVGNLTQNRSVDANDSDDFGTNIKINDTLLPVNETDGEPLPVDLTLSASLNSQVYSTTVLEPISLGAPIGGFAIFGGNGGAGSLVVLLVVVVVLGAVFVVVRKLRRARSI